MTDYAGRRRMMVDTQVRPSDVTKYPIIDAMLSVPREAFVPNTQREAAYVGENLPLGGPRVVLEPRTLAKMLDALNVTAEDVVLDIGTGFGYAAALLSKMAHAVVALEEEPSFVAEAEGGLAEHGADNAAVIEGALAEGAAKHGPYDVILIEGGVEHVPEAILDQLREGGRIAALFMDGALGVVRIGYRVDGKVNWRFAFNASAPVLKGFEQSREFAL